MEGLLSTGPTPSSYQSDTQKKRVGAISIPIQMLFLSLKLHDEKIFIVKLQALTRLVRSAVVAMLV